MVPGILRNNKNVMNMNLPKISALNESFSLWITNNFFFLTGQKND